MSLVCSVDGCKRKVYAKGICSLHYQREFRLKISQNKVKNTYIQSLEDEVWKIIPNTDDHYKVSNMGRVARCPFTLKNNLGRIYRYREKLLSLTKDRDGYYSCALTIRGCVKSFRVHRLVLLTFRPIPTPDEYQVNHMDGVKSNNRLENLEWCKADQNIRHRIYSLGVAAPRPLKRVRCIDTGEEFPSLREAARRYGNGNHSGLKQVLSEKYPTRHTYKGYHWEFC